MKNPLAIRRHHGSTFVTSVFLASFSGGLATNIAMIVGTATSPSPAGFYSHSAKAAFPLASVLRAAQDVCGSTCVTDMESLEEMLGDVRKQFDIVDECNDTDRQFALETLEHVFALASRDAWEALKEVEAGYPTSGGDFAAWKDELFKRQHP